MSTHHSAIYLPGLRSGILGGAFKPHVILPRGKDGKEAKDKAQAIRWIDALLRQGLTYTSSCPSPLPRGQCPGHAQKEA
mgnify:FL=1